MRFNVQEYTHAFWKRQEEEQRAQRRKSSSSFRIGPSSRAGSESDSEDDIPTGVRRRSGPAVSSYAQSIQDPSIPSGSPDSLFIAGPRRLGKGPFEQSSSDSDTPSSPKTVNMKSTGLHAHSEQDVMSPKDSSTPSKPTDRRSFVQAPTSSITASGSTDKGQSRGATMSSQRKGSSVAPGNLVKALASSMAPVPALPRKSLNVFQQRTPFDIPAKKTFKMKRTGTVANGAPAAIRMFNQPKTTTRKEWQNSDRHYGTLHYRRVAERRSQNEQAPDVSQLMFVNGSPPLSTTLATSPIDRDKPYDNPYGRREAGRPRVQQEDRDERPDADQEQQSATPREPVMLAEWEKKKIPLICFEYRNRQCLRPAQKCQFLHRAEGFPLSPADGSVPPKYYVQPVTCYHWLANEKGCYKNEEDCVFAHRNTGLVRCPGAGDRDIDRNLKPAAERIAGQKSTNKPTLHRLVTQELRPPPSEATCRFWQQGRCRFSADQCKYAHRETGVDSSQPMRAHSHWQRTRGHIPSPPFEVPRGDADDYPSYTDCAETAVPRSSNIPSSSRFGDPVRQVDASPSTPLINKAMSPAKITCVQLKEKIEQACRFDFAEMFRENETTALVKSAFLIFHPEAHEEELEIITRWLYMHHVEVTNFWVDGAWDLFKKNIFNGRSGVILTHPDVSLFQHIPEFGRILMHNVRILSVGTQEMFDYSPDDCTAMEIPRKWDWYDIFPHGGIIYMTDDIFIRTPQQALKIIHLFIQKVERCRQVEGGPLDPRQQVTDGWVPWRLATRPDLMQSLFDTLVAHEQDGDEHPDQMSRLQLYDLLTRYPYIAQDDGSLFVNRPFDYFPIISERKEMWPQYFKALTRSQEEANDVLVTLYAEHVLWLKKYYREFCIVHNEPSETGWQQKWQHCTEVMTPEQCIEYFEQEPKRGNRFQFYEWAFPDKKDVVKSQV